MTMRVIFLKIKAYANTDSANTMCPQDHPFPFEGMVTLMKKARLWMGGDRKQ